MIFIKKIRDMFRLIRQMNEKLIRLQNAVGRIELRQLAEDGKEIADYEFQVYSQWGEDGTIQRLIRNVQMENKIFVEFGVQDYMESNTRFLLVNNNWSGLIIDGSEENIEYVKKDPIYWRHNLKAIAAFIDSENINSLLESNGVVGDIGILSIDIDGNDYWVWEAINVISPRIVICEYNSLFGAKKKVTIPYKNNFVRSKAHHSNLYYGASISALATLGRQKEYALVCSNMAGNNLFFVRRDLLNNVIRENTQEHAYVEALFRESRDSLGKLSYLPFNERLKLISDMKLYDVETRKEMRIEEIYGLGIYGEP